MYSAVSGILAVISRAYLDFSLLCHEIYSLGCSVVIVHADMSTTLHMYVCTYTHSMCIAVYYGVSLSKTVLYYTILMYLY